MLPLHPFPEAPDSCWFLLGHWGNKGQFQSPEKPRPPVLLQSGSDLALPEPAGGTSSPHVCNRPSYFCCPLKAWQFQLRCLNMCHVPHYGGFKASWRKAHGANLHCPLIPNLCASPTGYRGLFFEKYNAHMPYLQIQLNVCTNPCYVHLCCLLSTRKYSLHVRAFSASYTTH